MTIAEGDNRPGHEGSGDAATAVVRATVSRKAGIPRSADSCCREICASSWASFSSARSKAALQAFDLAEQPSRSAYKCARGGCRGCHRAAGALSRERLAVSNGELQRLHCSSRTVRVHRERVQAGQLGVPEPLTAVQEEGEAAARRQHREVRARTCWRTWVRSGSSPTGAQPDSKGGSQEMRTLRATVGAALSMTSRSEPSLRSGWTSTMTYDSFCSRWMRSARAGCFVPSLRHFSGTWR